MENIRFQFTQDGSVGLYDEQAKDILHSVTGALKESYDKFICSTDYEQYCNDHSKVSVLDICYGIGYNSKSAILYGIKNQNKPNITLTALDINKELAFLSPFIRDGLNEPSVNLFLLANFIYNFDDYTEYINSFLKTENQITDKFFREDISLVFKNYVSDGYTCKGIIDLFMFIHNIYYQNVSTCMKNDLKPSDFKNITFDIKIGDARQTSKELKEEYNFVFLDGYTPHKQPMLWTYEFLSHIKSKMKSDGIISTYTNATPIRKTLMDLKFHVGKIIIDNKQFGTIGSADKNKIKNELSDFDLGLMDTRAGIAYRDNKSMLLTAAEILKNRNTEVKFSSKISSTEYKKRYKNEI